MTSFVHPEYASQHPGVVRAENAAHAVKAMAGRFDGARGAASLLLAAVVSALMVVANQIIDNWSQGHLMVAWVGMWAVAFAALALLATPARRAAIALRGAVARNAEARRQARSDARFWNVAMGDARMMAELSIAMSQARSVSRYY